MGSDGRGGTKRDLGFVVNYNGRQVHQIRRFSVSLVVKELTVATRKEELVIEMCNQNKKKKNQEV